MVKIIDALYRGSEKEFTVTLQDLNVRNYHRKYRGNLFCNTANCSAMISYVVRSGNRSYFRNWPGTEHDENCIYNSKKVAAIGRARAVLGPPVYLDDSQMNRSMKEAYQRELMIAEGEELSKRKSSPSLRKRQQSSEGNEQMFFSLTTDPAFENAGGKERKANLYKRDVHALTVKDIGQTRTIIGEFVEADFTGARPTIRIQKSGVHANLLLEEAFFAEVTAALDRLPILLRYTEVFASPIIVAVGEVREDQAAGEFAIALFNYNSLRVDGRSLDMLAARETVEQLSFQ